MTPSAAVLWFALWSTDANLAPFSRQDAIATAEFDTLQKAASKGDILAQRQLGDACARGEGIAANLPEAVKWYRRAAEQGDYESQTRLVDVLSASHESSQDKVEALQWLTIAKALAPTLDVVRLEIESQHGLADRMTAKDAEADAEAQHWLEVFRRRPQRAIPASTRVIAFQVGGGVVAPQLLRQARPAYAPGAMQKKIQGIVLVQGIVLPNGTLTDVRIVRSLDPKYGLDQEALNAARQWRFAPGTKDGVAVPVQISIELTFTLKK